MPARSRGNAATRVRCGGGGGGGGGGVPATRPGRCGRRLGSSRGLDPKARRRRRTRCLGCSGPPPAPTPKLRVPAAGPGIAPAGAARPLAPLRSSESPPEPSGDLGCGSVRLETRRPGPARRKLPLLVDESSRAAAARHLRAGRAAAVRRTAVSPVRLRNSHAANRITRSQLKWAPRCASGRPYLPVGAPDGAGGPPSL